MSIQIVVSKSFDNAGLSRYPDHLDIILEHFLAVHEKRCTIVGKAVAAPGAKYPQILPARDKSRQPVNGKKQEPG